MPNLDGGHYFLTTLAPIKVDPQPGTEPVTIQRVSPVQKVQEALQRLPTAIQSPATVATGHGSPFAKSLKTHLCRFVVIEDAIYNGRQSHDPILVSLGFKPQPLEPQHIDYLPCPYLFFSADIDAVLEPGDPLPNELSVDEQNEVRDRYLQDLWTESADQLREIYRHCQDFDADTMTAEGFADYLARCQIETWMPFNDYYINPKAVSSLPELPLKTFKFIVGGPALLTVACLVVGLVDSLVELISDKSFAPGWVWWGVPLFGLITWLAIKWAYNYTMEQGQKAWPAAQFGGLPSVLKGLFVQQHFAKFVIDHQTADAKTLHAAFGKFLKDTDPSAVLDTSKPPKSLLNKTQPPGVVSLNDPALLDPAKAK